MGRDEAPTGARPSRSKFQRQRADSGDNSQKDNIFKSMS
jgi:hypothetical protein